MLDSFSPISRYGGFAWTTQLVVGFGVTQAACGPALAVSLTPWEVALTIGAGIVAVAAQACALVLFRALRGVTPDDPGPRGRLYFFAVAALFGNTLFLGAIALTGIGVTVHVPCRQG